MELLELYENFICLTEEYIIIILFNKNFKNMEIIWYYSCPTNSGTFFVVADTVICRCNINICKYFGHLKYTYLLSRMLPFWGIFSCVYSKRGHASVASCLYDDRLYLHFPVVTEYL